MPQLAFASRIQSGLPAVLMKVLQQSSAFARVLALQFASVPPTAASAPSVITGKANSTVAKIVVIESLAFGVVILSSCQDDHQRSKMTTFQIARRLSVNAKFMLHSRYCVARNLAPSVKRTDGTGR
jgi:hypothetical protein